MPNTEARFFLLVGVSVSLVGQWRSSSSFLRFYLLWLRKVEVWVSAGDIEDIEN